MTDTEANLEKTKRFLFRQATKGKVSETFAERVLAQLSELLPLCGEYSLTKRMTQKIGEALLFPPLRIFAPTCPDYGHEGGVYTFHSLGGGVSLLAEKHIAFLKRIAEIIPTAEITIGIADQEADDPTLCRNVMKSQEEFRMLVSSTRAAIEREVANRGWRAVFMTKAVPALREEEARTAGWIKAEEKFRLRINSETVARLEMYRKINACMEWEEKVSRTIRTAAQYVALGRHLAAKGAVVCNHTTVNLSWYLQTDVTIIHNPIVVY